MATLQSIKAPTPLLPTQGPSMPPSVSAHKQPCSACSAVMTQPADLHASMRLGWMRAYRHRIQDLLQSMRGKKAPEAGDAAAHLIVDFNAPQPPPRPGKPSLAALAKAERERPHPR